MTKFISFLLTIAVSIVPAFSSFVTPVDFNKNGGDEQFHQSEGEGGTTFVGFKSGSSNQKILAAKVATKKACNDGYFRNPLTGRCKKLITISESSSTITSTIYNPATGQPTVKKVCKKGYWWNKKTERCNKKKECKIGYLWQSSNNTCKKIVCKFGFKVQDRSNVCKRIICEQGHILSQITGNCIINRHGKYKTCDAGWTLDLVTLKCAKIGTKGSNDPASKNAKKSQNLVVRYEIKQPITLSSTLISNGDSATTVDTEKEAEKTCPDGKFLNPQTNRCKNIQTIEETSTGKTITTYDPKTGEATVTKVCNDGYYLKAETNRCNKIKEEPTSSSNSGTTKTSSTSTTSTEKTCPEGKFLNPKTNRCKNLQTISESTTGKTITTYDPKTGEATTKKVCNEGYELNAETNRCKKKKENNGEDYKLEVPELGSEPKNSFIAIGSITTAVAIGLGFVIFQFRKEIAKMFKKICSSKKA